MHSILRAGRRMLPAMAERSELLRDAFAALDGGDVGRFRDLFREDAQWLGVPGRGWEGETPT